MATLNLEHCGGTEAYSEGGIEDELLAIVREGRDIGELLDNDGRWSILYHFSPARRALLEWRSFAPDCSVLEIGAGCGALTGLLCEKAARVTAVELSAKRSSILFQRYAGAANLEVCAGNVMDIPLERSYDCATLIGVLEYARAFSRTARPEHDLLRRAASLLKPGGRLLLAVENRYGLKYFAGAPEDHTGRMFDGIEGYPDASGVATFSRAELDGLLSGAGFADCRWYYPYPDYKFPSELFTDRRLPGANHKFCNAPNYDHARFQLFSERLAWSRIARDGDFCFFSNAFLVDAAAD